MKFGLVTHYPLHPPSTPFPLSCVCGVYVCFCLCVGPCVCMYACIYMCVFLHVCRSMCVHACLCVCVFVHVHVHGSMCVHACLCIYVFLHVCRSMCVHACLCIYVCFCMCVGGSMCVHVYGSLTLRLATILHCFSAFPLSQGVSIEPRAHQCGWPHRLTCSPLSEANTTAGLPLIYVGSGASAPVLQGRYFNHWASPQPLPSALLRW